MPRKVGWGDKSIGAGGGPDKERRFRGVKGTKFVIRVMSECEEYRQHLVHDVLEPGDDGEPRGFNMNCGKEWDEDKEDWVGECECCDREYDLSEKYIATILVVASYKGKTKTPTVIAPENSVHWWDFGRDKYKSLAEIYDELENADPPKKLNGVELTVTCEDDNFQKLNINVSQAKPFTTKAHVAAWKEEAEALFKEATQAPSLQEQKRRLKKRKRKGKGGDDDEDETPKGGSKARKRAKPKDEDEPDLGDEDGGGEEASTGDEELDDLLNEL